jgi:hypothetical protein
MATAIVLQGLATAAPAKKLYFLHRSDVAGSARSRPSRYGVCMVVVAATAFFFAHF